MGRRALLFLFMIFISISVLQAATGMKNIEVVFVSEDRVYARFSNMRMMSGRLPEPADSWYMEPNSYGQYTTKPFYLNCQVFTMEPVEISLSGEELAGYDASGNKVDGVSTLSWKNISQSPEWGNTVFSSTYSSTNELSLVNEKTLSETGKARYYSWEFVLRFDPQSDGSISKNSSVAYYATKITVNIEVTQ